MSETTRTFVAVAVPRDRAAKLGRLQQLLAADLAGVRWVDPGQMHVTLAFLGDVEHADLAAVCRAVGEAAAPFDPFDLRLEGLGVFPEAARPRVVWVGLVGEGVARLADLQKAVAKAVDQAGYPADDRFSPHVTLGRLKPRRSDPPANIGHLLRHYKGWSAGSIEVAEVITFSSTTGPDGPTYTPLARAPLGGEKARSPA